MSGNQLQQCAVCLSASRWNERVPHLAAHVLCPRRNVSQGPPCRGAARGKRRQCCSRTRGEAGRLLLWRLELCLFRQNWIPIAAAVFDSRTARAFAASSPRCWLEKALLQVLTAALLPSSGQWWPWIHQCAFCDKSLGHLQPPRVCQYGAWL